VAHPLGAVKAVRNVLAILVRLALRGRGHPAPGDEQASGLIFVLTRNAENPTPCPHVAGTSGTQKPASTVADLRTFVTGSDIAVHSQPGIGRQITRRISVADREGIASVRHTCVGR